jgi:hypothetical protein
MSDHLHVGTKVGNWQTLNLDGKRATCICVCGVARVLSTAALLDRSCAASCGCAALTPEQIAQQRGEAERQRRQRERGNWRPQS